MSYMPILKTIIKSLFKKPPTVSYPFKPIVRDSLVRGHVTVEIENCIYCGMCVRKCPTDAIATDKAKKEWEISHFKCIVCGACVEACPKKCMFMRPELTPSSNALTVYKQTGA